jgi:hypothetical protein
MPPDLPVAVRMHPAGQVVLPYPFADILVRWITNRAKTTMTVRPPFGLAPVLVGVSCSKEDPTGITDGERMTVEEPLAWTGA